MLRSLFGARSFLDADVEAWHLQTWQDLISRFAADVSLPETPLVRPTREFFPPTDATGHERALHVFDSIRRAMKIEDWPCELEAQSPRRGGQRVAEFVTLPHDQSPNGTFRVEPDGRVVITYAPDLVDRPADLVATLAHELAHYLLAGHADLAADETHELMTDLMVAYTGFGIFGANSAFNFSQYGDAFSQGWSSHRSGYLSPRSWAFALAVFASLHGDAGDLDRWLKPEIASMFRSAVKYLARHPELMAPLHTAATSPR